MKCKISEEHRHKISLALAKEIKKLELLADANDAELCRLMLSGAFEALRDDLELYMYEDDEIFALEEEPGFEGVKVQFLSRNIH